MIGYLIAAVLCATDRIVSIHNQATASLIKIAAIDW